MTTTLLVTEKHNDLYPQILPMAWCCLHSIFLSNVRNSPTFTDHHCCDFNPVLLRSDSLLQNHPKPTEREIEDVFDGNICRCTGYRPILDAMKTFASDYTPNDGQTPPITDIEVSRCKCKNPIITIHAHMKLILKLPEQLTLFLTVSLSYYCIQIIIIKKS